MGIEIECAHNQGVLCSACGEPLTDALTADSITPVEVLKLRYQAEILEQVARWSEQPDEPTGRRGIVSAFDLLMRAAALRAQADVMERD